MMSKKEKISRDFLALQAKKGLPLSMMREIASKGHDVFSLDIDSKTTQIGGVAGTGVPDMNIVNNEAAMEVLRNAAAKLNALGIKCLISPCDLSPYGMTVSLHVAETDAAMAAAHVAQSHGGAVCHTEPQLFASEVEDFIADLSNVEQNCCLKIVHKQEFK